VKLLRECNVDCTFCAAGPLAHPRSEQELVELLRSLRGRGIDTVNFDGGEATLSPLLLPGIRAARHLGFRHVQVVTNGVRLASRRFVRSLVDAGLDRVTFSLHAVDSATSRAIYGSDVHARQLRALEQIRQTEPRLGLSMSIVLVAANRASLGAILETVAAQQPEQISLKYCLPVLYSGRIANVPLAVLEDGEVLRVVQAFLRAHPDQQLELQHFPYCQLPAELWPLVREHGPAAATAPTRWRILEPSPHPNRRLCSGCDHRDLCSFPLRAYLLQRRNGAELLRGLALSLLGDDALSRGFRGAAPSS
jgi:pyruvate-formate lyase-activating enzyme